MSFNKKNQHIVTLISTPSSQRTLFTTTKVFAVRIPEIIFANKTDQNRGTHAARNILFFLYRNKIKHVKIRKLKMDLCDLETPFEYLSDRFFHKRGRMLLSNQKRNASRQSRILSNDNGVQFSTFSMSSEVSQSIEDSIKHLEDLMKTSSKNKQRSVVGCKAVLKHIKSTCPVAPVKELTTIYQTALAEFLKTELSLKRMPSSELQERFKDNGLELINFYMYGEAFTIFPKTENVHCVVKQLQNIVPVDDVVKESLLSKLEDVFKVSLEMLTSKSDREIVQALFATATSSKFTAKLKGMGYFIFV